MNHFKDCEILMCEQRSDAWFEARKGILTASAIGKWLIQSTATAAKAQTRAVCKTAAESAGCHFPPTFVNFWMARGTDLEPESIASLEESQGIEIKEVGFALHKNFSAGCSPDGIIQGVNAGVETKAPAPDAHLSYVLDSAKLLEAYEMQVQFSLAVTGADYWLLQSYCPGLPAVVLTVKKSDLTERVLDGIEAFDNELLEAQNILANKWQEDFEAKLVRKGGS